MSEPSSLSYSALVRATAAVSAFTGYEPGPRWSELVHNVAVAIEAAVAEERKRCARIAELEGLGDVAELIRMSKEKTTC